MDIDMDPLDGFFADEGAQMVQAVGKFQPKSKPKFQPTRKDSATPSVTFLQPVQSADNPKAQLLESVRTAKASENCLDVVSNEDEDQHAQMEKSIPENAADIFIELDALGDILPNSTTNIGVVPSSDEVAFIASNPENVDPHVSPIPTALEDAIGTFKDDDVSMCHELSADLDPLTADVSIVSSSDGCGQMPDEQFGREEIDIMDNLDGEPEIPAKLASRRANTRRKTHIPSPQHQPVSMSCDHETGGILRLTKNKRNLCELVGEADEEVLASGDISDPAQEEENDVAEEIHVENESQTKKVKRTSKKPNNDSKKATRNQKKAEKTPDSGADAKPKKFPHTTRRRRVDKVLLETPEDEIDYQKLPLRDLILLAEHKERLLKKDEAVAAETTKKQSNGNSSGHHNDDGPFNSQQDEDYNDGQDSPTMEDTTVYFNYQTHMDKTPVSRWSKQETELFYEAVRQFGTDLSMIQQLFPGRTRRQVKLKYKKEERQHPLRLREALEKRSNDHSHFEKLVEYLKKKSAEENQNAGNDDPVVLIDEDVVEGTLNVDKEETHEEKTVEQVEKGEKVEAVKNFEVQSPLEIGDNDLDNDDDLFDWSQYKSDT